jgi:hypothetical protein
MNNICPSGHTSSQADFCSECGLEINQAGGSAQVADAGAAPPVIVPENCPKCHTERDTPTTQFCGVCGYDYVNKQGGEVVAPEPAPSVPLASAPSVTSKDVAVVPQNGARMDIRVSVDESKKAAPIGQPALTFSLFEDESLIGRRSGSVPQTVSLDDAAVSKRHALIIRQADGTYVVRDLNSKNGTFLNGKAITAGADAVLKESDVITIGQWTRVTVVAIRKA